MYEPKLPELLILKSRLSESVWETRERNAREADQRMRELSKKIDGEGKSFNQAVAELLPSSKRSWAVRMWKRWRQLGFEGMFDVREPPKAPMTKACKDLITGARLADRHLSVEKALKILTAGGVRGLPSVATIKRLFHNADSRRFYYENKAKSSENETPWSQSKTEEEAPVADFVEVQELELAGGELLKAAALETGALHVLTGVATALATAVDQATGDREPTGNNTLRNEGKFTAGYNHARARKEGEVIAPYLCPAEEKGASKVAADFCFVSQEPKSIERKLAALVYEPLVNPGRGWDGLRSVSGQNLESLVGYPYMPATLQKLASELAQMGAGQLMLDAVGLNWHRVASTYWGEPGALAALYVDNHAKEVWSTLFTKAGKVSHRSRVMPCITNTYVQTGAGTPVIVMAHSGSAPLAPKLCGLVEEAEARLGDEIRRALVVDAEGSTFDILESFKNQRRVMVTPCKPSTFRDLELRYSKGSSFRSYRERDEIRVATATLLHKSTGRELELGVLLIRRDRRISPFVLLTTGLELGFKGKELADLYFRRWPLQENFFKNGLALGLDRHRGNSGRMVLNVAIATELEGLEVRLVEAEQKLGRLNAQQQELNSRLDDARCAHRQVEDKLEHHRLQMSRMIESGETSTEAFEKASVAHFSANEAVESTKSALDRAKNELEHQQTKRVQTLESIEKMSDRARVLEPMRMIRQLDVALDSVLTAMRLTLSMLITFACREYFPSDNISAETFIGRLLTIRGRQETTETEQRIIFYENPRDPRISAVLAEACELLNQRRLERDDRRLHFELGRAPPSSGISGAVGGSPPVSRNR